MSISKARNILGEDKIIGATVYSVEEAIQAWKDGADYLGCGSAFAASGKQEPMDRDTYCKITSAVPIPVCAVGGIDSANVHQLSGLGLDGVAVICSDYIAAATRQLRKLADHYCKGKLAAQAAV